MKLKSLIVGFIAGAFAATAFTVGASSIYEKYTATARPDYAIVVDGEKVTLNTPPKTIDGVTHLPIRETATILGMDVSFKSSTITLTSRESEGENIVSENNTVSNEVSENVFVSGRKLVDLIADKHNLKKVYLSIEGRLTFSDKEYFLEIDENNNFNVTPLIEDGIISLEDIQ